VNLLCLDVGSTWTKGALVSPAGDLLGTAQHVTTPPEVMDGIASVTASLGAASAEVLACSSAGGGLRLAVVGQERLISAEAGYRVALSAGAKVVHVSAGLLSGRDVAALRATRPDVVLLVGGTDGGDEKVLLHNASRLAAARIRVPIVLAGNLKARDSALDLLRGRTVVATDNVLPDVGELAPTPARNAIRSVFLDHVIGGKHLSRGQRFRRLVRTVTPDAVLTAVSRLAHHFDGSGAILVVDVGGATTDVYSAVSTKESSVHAVNLPPDRRTVEGDIGMRWSAPGTITEAVAENLIPADPVLTAETGRLAANPAIAESEVDTRLAALAATIALRRHLRLIDGRLGPQGAALLVLSGGTLRHATPEVLAGVTGTIRTDPVLRPHLRAATVTVDRRYVLAPAGLLAAAGHRDAADRLLGGLGVSRAREDG
jgi:uncharacterized protein (TIGR01319 family)